MYNVHLRYVEAIGVALVTLVGGRTRCTSIAKHLSCGGLHRACKSRLILRNILATVDRYYPICSDIYIMWASALGGEEVRRADSFLSRTTDDF